MSSIAISSENYMIKMVRCFMERVSRIFFLTRPPDRAFRHLRARELGQGTSRTALLAPTIPTVNQSQVWGGLIRTRSTFIWR